MFEDITKYKKIENEYSRKERINNILSILKGEEEINGIKYLDSLDLNVDNFVDELTRMLSYIEHGE